MIDLRILIEGYRITEAAAAIRKEMGPADDPELPALETLEHAVSFWLEDCLENLLKEATWHTDSPHSTMTTEWRDALRRAENKAVA